MTDFDNNLTDDNLDNEFFTGNEGTLVDRILDDGNFANRRNTSTDRMSFIEYNDLSDNAVNDSDNDVYYNIDIDTEEDSDIDKIDSDRVSDMEIDANNDFGLKSDISSVTDNRYLINKEEIRIIF